MLDSIYHMTLKSIKKSLYWRDNVKILQLMCNVLMEVIL